MPLGVTLSERSKKVEEKKLVGTSWHLVPGVCAYIGNEQFPKENGRRQEGVQEEETTHRLILDNLEEYIANEEEDVE